MGRDEEESTGIKVTDRRRLDSDGNPKGEGDSKESSGSSAGSSDSNRKPQDKRSAPQTSSVNGAASNGVPAEEASRASVDFASLVLSFAHSAMVQMGEAQAPEGAELPVNLPSAKQAIDMLAMLKEKTKGNLTSEEAHMIEDVLHHLRLSFVKATKERS